ncbi:hypothetical protein ACTXT7_013992 [Hymenolepis weldensis]
MPTNFTPNSRIHYRDENGPLGLSIFQSVSYPLGESRKLNTTRIKIRVQTSSQSNSFAFGSRRYKLEQTTFQIGKKDSIKTPSDLKWEVVADHYPLSLMDMKSSRRIERLLRKQLTFQIKHMPE